jgi:Tfp pilus assembly PilM family ATPase
MNGAENSAGFNITNSKLQVVEVSKDSDQFILSNLSEVNFDQPIDFISDKDVIIKAELQSAFDKLKLKKSVESKNSSFILPSELFLTMQVPYDTSLLHKDLVDEFKWELSILHPTIQVEDLIVRYVEVEKNLVITKNTSIVTALNRRYIIIIKDFCANNNLNLRFMDSAHFAAERSVKFSSSYIKDGLTLSVYASNRLISLLISYNTKPVYYKLYSIKKEEQIAEIVNKELLPSDLKYINKNLITSSYISGDDISSELKSKLDRTVNLNFNVFNPFRKIKASPELEKNDLYNYKFNSFASAAGIAYRT